MHVDAKESFRISAIMNGDDVIHYIESVCNGCRSQKECNVTKTFPVLDQCENFKDHQIPLIRDIPRHSVFVFPSSPLYLAIAREFPEGKLHSDNEGETGITSR
jgi:hypothetical protein